MPLSSDKQRLNTSKPLTPTLSSTFRNGKPSLTPRLAGSSPSSPVFPVRSRSPGKRTERETTPLATNITPRSGARNSRHGTESPSTPAAAKSLNNPSISTPSPPDHVSRPQLRQPLGIGISSPRMNMSTPSLQTPNSTSTPAITVHRRISAAKSMVEGAAKEPASKFFHANQLKSPSGSPRLESTAQPPASQGRFFVGSPPLSATAPNPPASTPRPSEQDDSKFFRADDVPQNHLPKRPNQRHLATDREFFPSAVESVQLQQTTNPRTNHATPPQSPVKTYRPPLAQPSSPQKTLPKSDRAAPPFARSQTDRPKSITSRTTLDEKNDQNGHRKSNSASSITSASARRLSGPRAPPPQPLDMRSVPSTSPRIIGTNMFSPETLSPRSISLASSNTVPTSVNSETDTSDVPKSQGMPLGGPDHLLESISSPQPQLDGAANARRERKVLDLEISNSSLLAINKTLERELRKQSVELRRFRRLSRSGRLSLAPTTRSVSGQSAFSLDTVTEMEGEDHPASDGEDDSDFDEIDDEDGSILSNESGSLTSVSARSRQRARDEKRLMLDLSKHQQLLVDSQKLSQSIKRCLTCTEELIRDGNKALEYRVGIGDVKLGGRVLNDEELDERGLDEGSEEMEPRRGLLSPSLATSRLDEVHAWNIDSHTMTIPSGFSELEDLTEILESATTNLTAHENRMEL